MWSDEFSVAMTPDLGRAISRDTKQACWYGHQLEKRIAIREGMSQIQTVKTSIHEMAHQKLHAVAPKQQSPSQEMETITRNGKEVEAESVAYTVCQHYGLDTSEYSFAYIVVWSQGKETPELKASLNTIRRAASEMIQDIDHHIRELEQEREGKAEIRAATEQENKKKSLLENLHEKQGMVKENFKAQCKSQSKEIE